jgi:hypothetical protein
MIQLIDGYGQLGTKLKELLQKIPKHLHDEDVLIYHTWNIDDKSAYSQKKEYDKFIDFVDFNIDKKIIFISTYSQKENFYNHYKQLATAYLISNCKKGLVIKLPTIIGKGVCREIKNKDIKAYGQMELITLTHAAKSILDLIMYDGLLKVINIDGEKIQAKLVEAIIHEIKI